MIISRGARMIGIKGNGDLGVNKAIQSFERINYAFKSISGNVARLAETETRMEAFKLRNKILQELETIKPILYQSDLRKDGAVLGESENGVPELKTQSFAGDMG